jgi:hypothetical protein
LRDSLISDPSTWYQQASGKSFDVHQLFDPEQTGWKLTGMLRDDFATGSSAQREVRAAL